MSALATLRDMMIAAHAAGDPDTADWLASIASDPEMVGRVTGEVRESGPPSPGLVPKSGDPQHPGHWVLPKDISGNEVSHDEIARAKADPGAREDLTDRVGPGRDSSLLRFHLHGGKVRFGYEAQEAVKQTFGRDPSEDEWRAMACAPPGAAVEVRKVAGGGLIVTSDHPDVSSVRLFKPTPDGLVCVNKSIEVHEKGTGLGTKLFAEQVAALKAAGVKRIETDAARDEGVIGYKVWPKLGYDGPIPKTVEPRPPEFAGAETVGALMATAAGRAWWDKHGDSAKLTFDLADGSRSLAVLRAYQEAKRRG